jgi:mannosyltransferase OCH1-like enzyme
VGPHEVPKNWILSWKNKHPDWDFILWNEQNIVGFECQHLIDYCMRKGIYPGVADIVRYEVLYKYGGVAVDADSECLHPIDELLNIEEDCFCCYESEKRKPALLSPQIGATKGNKLMRAVIDALKAKDKVVLAWMDTGNLLLTCIAYEMHYPIKIYPSHYFIPIYIDGEQYEGNDKIYAVQKWHSTNTLKLWKQP